MTRSRRAPVRRSSQGGSRKSRRGLWYRVQCWFIKSFFFDTKMRVEFYRVIKALTGNGVSIQASLKLYGDMIAKHDKSKEMLKFIIDDVLQLMQQGVRYEQAISAWVPVQEAVLIQSSAKDVAKACSIITKFTENMLSIKGALYGALTYPTVMLFVLIGCLGAFSFFIMPSMVDLSPPDRWPQEAKALYAFSNFITENATLILVALVSLFAFMFWSMQHLTFMPVRIVFDKLAPWNIYKPFTSTTFLIAVASLLRTGSSYNQALMDIKKTASPYLIVFIDRILKRLAGGSNFGDSLEVGLFEGNILISLTVFAMTNRLEQGIQFLADENLDEQQILFETKGKFLGYIMMFLVAGTIGWVMLSLYGMQSTIQA